jgi:hypothetical protein
LAQALYLLNISKCVFIAEFSRDRGPRACPKMVALTCRGAYWCGEKIRQIGFVKSKIGDVVMQTC